MKIELYLYIFVLLTINTIQEDIDVDISNKSPIARDAISCTDHKDTSTCSSVQMISNVYQCCKASMSMYGYLFTLCSPWIIQDLSDEQIKDLEESMKESYGFLKYAVGLTTPSFTIEYNCPKKTYSIHLGPGTYSEEEINILKDDNYCMKLYYTGLYELGVVSSLLLLKERK